MKLSFWTLTHSCLGLALISGLLVSIRDVNAQTFFPSFSADQIHTVGKRVTTGKVYSNGKAIRVEGEQKGKKSIMIIRMDQKVMWNLMPDQKMYMEMRGFGLNEFAGGLEGAKVERESLGTEQVGAYNCEKYRVQTTYEGHVYTGIEWDAKELNAFPVKRADEKGDWSTEYQNVHLGAQDPSLFEIPDGYKKFSLGGFELPKGPR